MNKTLPITKNDVQYNTETAEVTLKRDKFDELMKFLRGTLQELENAQDAKHIAQFEARRSSASADVFKIILEDLDIGTAAITRWASERSIRELSTRTRIPYATCHRIVTRELAKGNVRLHDYATLLRATTAKEGTPIVLNEIGKKGSYAIRNVVVGAGSGKTGILTGLEREGVKITYVRSGREVLKAVKDVRPDLVILESSSSQYSAKDVGQIFGAAEKSPVFVVGKVNKKSITESAEKIMKFAVSENLV